MGTRAEQTSDHVCNWGSFQEFSGRKVLAGSSSNSLALKSSLSLPSWARPLESHPPFTTAKRTKHFPRAGLNPVLLPTPCCSLSGGGGKYYCSCKAALLPTTSPEPPAQPASAGCFCGRLLSALSPWESGCLSAFSPGGGYARSIQHPLSAGLFLSLY